MAAPAAAAAARAGATAARGAAGAGRGTAARSGARGGAGGRAGRRSGPGRGRASDASDIGQATRADQAALRAQASRAGQAAQAAYEAGLAGEPLDPALADDPTARDAWEAGRDEQRGERRREAARRVAAPGGPDWVNDGAGVILGAVVYAVAINFLRGGRAQARGWIAAKFINRPYEGT